MGYDENSILLSILRRRRSIYPKQYVTDTTQSGSSRTSNSSSSGAALAAGQVGVPRQVVEQMLEAARWAPTHHLTQPWRFVVYESADSRTRLGNFLADQYRNQTMTATTGEINNSSKINAFSQKKYNKKIQNCLAASYVIAIVCDPQNQHRQQQQRQQKQMQASSGDGGGSPPPPPEGNKTNPVMEDISSVAMAVQNMHLVATAASAAHQQDHPEQEKQYRVGAYWSSGGIYDTNSDNITVTTAAVTNPPALRAFLEIDDKDNAFCMGWFFVGSYVVTGKRYQEQGRRDPMDERRLQWL
jgi:nitroreductase